MKAPWLWMVFPGLVGIVLLIARPPTRRGAWWAGGLALFLSVLAVGLPVGTGISIPGGFAFHLDARMVILGRQFVFSNASRLWLAMLYGTLALWLIGIYPARMSPLVPGLSLMATALGVGALAVQPSLFAVLFIALAAWGSLPLLVNQETPQYHGAVRWLTFQTLAVPVLLYAGWLLSGSEVGLEKRLALRTMVLLGLGMALLLALFPFHSPISLLSEETSPYALIWVVLMELGVGGTWGMAFLYSLPWIGETRVLLWVQTIGVLMWALGGFLAPFQRHAGRMLGYVVLAESGTLLVALSLGQTKGVPLFFLLWLVRAVALVIWGGALAQWRLVKGALTFRALQGMGKVLPLTGLSTVVAVFTLAGAPWLPGFPLRMALWRALASAAPWALGAALLGSVGLWGAGWRLVGVLFSGEPNHGPIGPPRRFGNWGLSLFGLLALFLGGVFPDWWITPFVHWIQRLWFST